MNRPNYGEMLSFLLLLMSNSEQTPQNFIAYGAKIETIASGLRFTEGPVETWDGGLIFSDIPANKVYRLREEKLTVYRENSRGANGNTLDSTGRILTCEHGSRQVVLFDGNGKETVLASTFEGKRLNSPNDVAFRTGRGGSIYFTDPPYGIRPEEAELGFNGVFLIKGGKLSAVAKDFDRPNGLVFSPDQNFLYVADTSKNHIRRFQVQPDGTLKGGEEWAKTPSPDGLRVDRNGRVWSASGDGVNVIEASGKILQVIPFPQVPANLAFSRDGRTLYVTARTAVYRVRVTVTGIAP